MVLHDSGARRQFDTGAVRDIQEGKGRCDLLPLDIIAEYFNRSNVPDRVLTELYEYHRTGDYQHLIRSLAEFNKYHWRNNRTMFLEVSKHFEDGAKKYGENNWQKGIPIHCYLDSAIRHYLKWLRHDEDEPHDRAFVWNIVCAIWTIKHKPDLIDIIEESENE